MQLVTLKYSHRLSVCKYLHSTVMWAPFEALDARAKHSPYDVVGDGRFVHSVGSFPPRRSPQVVNA